LDICNQSMKKWLLVVGILFAIPVIGQESVKMDWNGYTQLRMHSNFRGQNNFMLRRLKFWMKSNTNFSKHWSYKLQTTISSLQKEHFFLQDVRIGYQTGQFRLDMGQFVPAYSLQRSQSDYTLDFIERAKPVDYLLPGTGMGFRDIGAQINYFSKSSFWEISLGVFNGYGIKDYILDNQGYMLTHKTTIKPIQGTEKIKLGYSLQYRKANNIQLKYILPDDFRYFGDEFRYNLFAMYRSKNLHLQTEYLAAKASNHWVGGYYFSAALKIKERNQLALSYEKNSGLIGSNNNSPFFHIAYNYFFNKRKLMLFLDNAFQLNDGEADQYLLSIQLQIFFK